MAFETIRNEVASLIRYTTKTRDVVQATCGLNHDLSREANNLRCILLRLECEIDTDPNESPLVRHGDTRKDNLEYLLEGCTSVLDDMMTYLVRYKAKHDQEQSILASKDRTSFNEAEKAVLHKFHADLIYYAFHLAHLIVKASMDSLGEVKDRIDDAGYSLRFGVNITIARLLANNEISISELMQHPNGDVKLWKELHQELEGEGFAISFLEDHRYPILTYVKAVERSSFRIDCELPIPPSPGIPQDDRYFTKSPLSRKRTRSNEMPSRVARLDSKTNSFDSFTDLDTKKDQQSRKAFRFSDPLEVFQKFMDRDGIRLNDEEVLSEFLSEETFSRDGRDTSNPLRDQAREIYKTFCNKYEKRCDLLLEREGKLDQGGNDLKETLFLIYEIERHVLEKLDLLEPGHDKDLRSIRKKLVDKVQRTLDDLEKAKTSLGG